MKQRLSGVIAGVLTQLGGLPEPWRVSVARLDREGKVIDLWVTRAPAPPAKVSRRWFGRDTVDTGVEESLFPMHADIQWQHISCMGFVCRVHTQDTLSPADLELPWFGQANMPFTNQLVRQVFICLGEGMDLGAICTLLQVPFADLWKLKHAMDNGLVTLPDLPKRRSLRAGSGGASPDTKGSEPVPAVPRPVPAALNGLVPESSDPIWEALITGRCSIRIKALSFQLILTKIRQQVSLQTQEEVKAMKRRELHRYVDRNARLLAHELAQLRVWKKEMQS